jgi:hypothetical protein
VVASASCQSRSVRRNRGQQIARSWLSRPGWSARSIGGGTLAGVRRGAAESFAVRVWWVPDRVNGSQRATVDITRSL